MHPTKLQCKLLVAWVGHSRWPGGQNYMLRNSYTNTLQTILPNVPDNGAIDSWVPLARNWEHWKQIGTEWLKCQQAIMIYIYGYHPLLGGTGILDHKYQWYLQDVQHRYSISPMATNRQ